MTIDATPSSPAGATASDDAVRLQPYRLGYVSLEVEDMDAAVAWWTTFAMLEVSTRTDEAVYLRGGTDHHWVVLRHDGGTPGVRRIAFEVEHRSDLSAFRERLEAEDLQVTEHDGDFTGAALRVADPDGYEIELFADMGNMGVAPSEPWINPADLLHAVVAVADLDRSYDFYTRVLGFQESDRVIDKTVFLRAGNQFHHALVIGAGRGEPPLLDHVAMHFEDIDDLMRVRQNFLERDEPLDRDLLRHPTSGSMGFYGKMHPAPSTVEFCMDHAKITDPNHRPRMMAKSRWASNVWRVPAGS